MGIYILSAAIIVLAISIFVSMAMGRYLKRKANPEKIKNGLMTVRLDLDAKDAQSELGRIEVQLNRIHLKVCAINETILKGRAEYERTAEATTRKAAQVSGYAGTTENAGGIYFGG
jgi:methyl-accepting chemotaxis protein